MKSLRLKSPIMRRDIVPTPRCVGFKSTVTAGVTWRDVEGAVFKRASSASIARRSVCAESSPAGRVKYVDSPQKPTVNSNNKPAAAVKLAKTGRVMKKRRSQENRTLCFDSSDCAGENFASDSVEDVATSPRRPLCS